MDAILSLKHVSKTYQSAGETLRVLDDISFDVEAGSSISIIGPSGSGKTTILKNIGNVKKVNFDAEKPLISNFDWLDPKDATFVLTSMGLSSVPTWLRPFHTLSNGEQYRATLAY